MARGDSDRDGRNGAVEAGEGYGMGGEGAVFGVFREWEWERWEEEEVR